MKEFVSTISGVNLVGGSNASAEHSICWRVHSSHCSLSVVPSIVYSNVHFKHCCLECDINGCSHQCVVSVYYSKFCLTKRYNSSITVK